MSKQNLVSLELAKKLKEGGFKEEGEYYYYKGMFLGVGWILSNDRNLFDAEVV